MLIQQSFNAISSFKVVKGLDTQHYLHIALCWTYKSILSYLSYVKKSIFCNQYI